MLGEFNVIFVIKEKNSKVGFNGSIAVCNRRFKNIICQPWVIIVQNKKYVRADLYIFSNNNQ